ncbi:Histidine kinase [Hyella patelloides LEGE 07179]|uniref:histidine kinase n=1 Tax=Hyella patelloides LEGE 07179 TaxID=945734 RepID=A0A563VM74_9CYAN|nr:sensor histidine kinase [Hyella patelloides]VEP12521.1 Histidine kinase [Hyella patelloides LEGE 07179]
MLNTKMFSRLKQLKTYPFGLFLWLEWILLGSALLVELPSNYIGAEYSNPNLSVALKFTLSLLCMLLLGAMGLKLPKKKNFHKWLYFSTQITLIWLPVISSNQYDFLSLFSYLIVVIRNGLIFKQRQCWLANILLFLSFIPSLTFFDSFSEFQATISRYQTVTFDDYQWLIIVGAISNLILYALCIIIFWVLVHVLLREYKSQQQLAIAREQLRQYALKAEDRATVHERNRIAREIHDSVGHVLTAQTIQLNNAIAFWNSEPTKAYQFLTEAKELVATALKEIRYSVSTLRADPLAEKSLKTAISELFQEFSSRTGIVPHYNINLTYSLAEETKLTVYRILQEALTNIAKHSEATAVIVELQTFPEHLYLLIEDNGKGFYPEQNTTGFGLQGMQERVTALKGNIKIASDLKQGCNITITIPYQTLLLINSK